jgi:hypothetical protein
MRPEDQDFTCDFTLEAADLADETGPKEVAAVVLWFDTDFSAARCPEAPVKLSTSPHSPATHWAQTVLPLQQPVMLSGETDGVLAGSGGVVTAKCLTGRLSMSRNTAKHRSLDIALEVKASLSDGTVVHHTRIYTMDVLGE